jgi:hypothetical protein
MSDVRTEARLAGSREFKFVGESSDRRSPGKLRDVAGLCIRLGTFAFGGPAADIALFRGEVVRRPRWLSGRGSWTCRVR